MRILKIISAIAVLFTSLAFVHLFHHFAKHAPHDQPWVWALLVVMAIAGIFSFVGGFLLLKSAR
jgi:CDP-diglyceride synthetase